MHIKAIQIKEQLLGQEDYEVALSVGHLASLYNYDMNQYDDAERLYLRSIAIGEAKINVLAYLSKSHTIKVIKGPLLKSIVPPYWTKRKDSK